MTRSQVLILSVLTGFVILVFMALIALWFLNPIPRVIPPTATPIPPTPMPTATPTFPNFMPTPGPTPTPPEPTPINTRVPTVTPKATSTPLPTVIIVMPTRRPTSTPTSAGPIAPLTTETPTPTITPTAIPRVYKISFKADDTTLVKGECTELKWDVIGALTVELDRDQVSPSGKKKVCPKENTSYKLIVQFQDSARLQTETIDITVTKAE